MVGTFTLISGTQDAVNFSKQAQREDVDCVCASDSVNPASTSLLYLLHIYLHSTQSYMMPTRPHFASMAGCLDTLHGMYVQTSNPSV